MAGKLVAPADWQPEFEGQRPPFTPGNDLAVKHGAFSDRRVDPVANRYRDEVLSDPTTTYLTAPRFANQLWQWCVASARVELLTIWVDSMPVDQQTYSGKGQVSPLELLRKWMSTLQTLSARLGLDPLSSARLGKDIATSRQASAATMLTELRAIHEAAGTANDTPPGGPEITDGSTAG